MNKQIKTVFLFSILLTVAFIKSSFSMDSVEINEQTIRMYVEIQKKYNKILDNYRDKSSKGLSFKNPDAVRNALDKMLRSVGFTQKEYELLSKKMRKGIFMTKSYNKAPETPYYKNIKVTNEELEMIKRYYFDIENSSRNNNNIRSLSKSTIEKYIKKEYGEEGPIDYIIDSIARDCRPKKVEEIPNCFSQIVLPE